MIYIILRSESGPERILAGILGWVLIIGIIAVFKGAKKAVKGKTFEEGEQ